MLTKDKSDILKGIAAILMLAHHLFGFPGWVIEANSYTGIINTNLRAEEIIGSFGNICVGMFAFCLDMKYISSGIVTAEQRRE